MARRPVSKLTFQQIVTVSLFALVVCPAHAQSMSVFANVSGQGVSASAPTPWTDSGFGRLQAGDDTEGSDETLIGIVDVGFEWLPSQNTAVFIHGLASGESKSVDDWTAGVVEAWGEVLHHFDSTSQVRARAGMMILPTSRENTEEFWKSRYLISFSAINSWIAEEVRPTGIDLEYRFDDGTRSARAAVTAFVGNDTSGTLLAWRGWSLGTRLTRAAEELPLPPLHSLPDSFPLQKDGTTPALNELDGEVGWAARLRYDEWSLFTLQATHYDNRGDRGLHGDEYAWQTKFDLYAIEIRPGAGLTFISEHLTGSTAMGPDVGDHVEADFDATYFLAHWEHDRIGISARYDRFRTIERDFTTAENNDEDGESAAVSVSFQPIASVRIAVEYLDADVERQASLDSGGPLQNGGDSISLQVRYSF